MARVKQTEKERNAKLKFEKQKRKESELKKQKKHSEKKSKHKTSEKIKSILKQNSKNKELTLIPKRYAKQAKKIQRSEITWGVISKLAKKSGIKRLSHFPEPIRKSYVDYVRSILNPAIVMCDYMRQKTITYEHIASAGLRRGEKVFGAIQSHH